MLTSLEGSWQKGITIVALGPWKVTDVECLSKYCIHCQKVNKYNHTTNDIGYNRGMETQGAVALFSGIIWRMGIQKDSYK